MRYLLLSSMRLSIASLRSQGIRFFMQMFDHDLMEHLVCRLTCMLRQRRVTLGDGQTLLYRNLRPFGDHTSDGSYFIATLRLLLVHQLLVHQLLFGSTTHCIGPSQGPLLRILRELHFNDNSTAIP